MGVEIGSESESKWKRNCVADVLSYEERGPKYFELLRTVQQFIQAGATIYTRSDEGKLKAVWMLMSGGRGAVIGATDWDQPGSDAAIVVTVEDQFRTPSDKTFVRWLSELAGCLIAPASLLIASNRRPSDARTTSWMLDLSALVAGRGSDPADATASQESGDPLKPDFTPPLRPAPERPARRAG